MTNVEQQSIELYAVHFWIVRSSGVSKMHLTTGRLTLKNVFHLYQIKIFNEIFRSLTTFAVLDFVFVQIILNLGLVFGYVNLTNMYNEHRGDESTKNRNIITLKGNV